MFTTGIYVYDQSTNIVLENITLIENTQGIRIFESSFVTIIDSMFQINTHGVLIKQSNHNNVIKFKRKIRVENIKINFRSK